MQSNYYRISSQAFRAMDHLRSVKINEALRSLLNKLIRADFLIHGLNGQVLVITI